MSEPTRAKVVGQRWRFKSAHDREEFTLTEIDQKANHIEGVLDNGAKVVLGYYIENVADWVSDPWRVGQLRRGPIYASVNSNPERDPPYVSTREYTVVERLSNVSGWHWLVRLKDNQDRTLFVMESWPSELLMDAPAEAAKLTPAALAKPKSVELGQRWTNGLGIERIVRRVCADKCEWIPYEGLQHAHFDTSWQGTKTMLTQDHWVYLGMEVVPWAAGQRRQGVIGGHEGCEAAVDGEARFVVGKNVADKVWTIKCACGCPSLKFHEGWPSRVVDDSEPTLVWVVGTRRRPKPDGAIFSDDMGYVEVVKVMAETGELRYRYQDEDSTMPSRVCSMDAMERETEPEEE